MRGWDHAKKQGLGKGSAGNPVPGNIPRVLDELGIEYRERGNECQGLCPAPDHDDSSPSWSVNTDTGQHNCFSCGFKGTFVHLVVSVTGLGWSDAALYVRQRGGIEKVRAYLESKPKPVVAPRREAELAKFEYPPLSALSSRLLSLDACMELGVLWDVEREMWITPIRDPKTNKLWGWQEKNARLFRNFPPDVSKSKTLFGLDAFRRDNATCAVLVESPLDVVRLRSVGISGGLSSYGVQISKVQLGILLDVANETILALDNDRAGMDKAIQLRREFRQLPTRLFNYGDSDAKDIGELGATAIQDGIRTAYAYRRK